MALNNGLSTFATIATSRGKAVTNLLPQNLPAAQNLTCDLNGNLTSDGLHGYVYDCRQRIDPSATDASTSPRQGSYGGLAPIRQSQFEFSPATA
ncbi:MAG: hypothetical protein ABSH48_26515 [Verrucomicrobiota bacterium]